MATAEDFLTLLPQFEDVEPATIDRWLVEAAKTVTVDWGVDQDTAQIYLAAHLMSMAGIGPESGAAGLAPLRSFTSGSVSMTKDERLGDFGLTSFGRLYVPIWRSYLGGPFVTGTGDYPWPYGGEGPPYAL